VTVNRDRWLRVSDRLFRGLVRFYPQDFRDDLGESLVETYRDRARRALKDGGMFRLIGVWLGALKDALISGPGERHRPGAWWRRPGNWGRDLEFARRRLMRSPALVLAVVGTLTVGLGAFAVVYTAVQKILLEPMPYRNPDDLYFVWRDYRAFFDLERGWLGGTDVAALQKAGGVIEDAAGMLRTQTTFSVREGTDSLQVPILITSPNLFTLLGVAPAIGRGFHPNEVGPGRPAVIVLTHELWQKLGGGESLLNTDVRLNGQPYSVIGIMPAGFTFRRNASLGVAQSADAFTTFDVDLATTNPNAGSYAGLIRARPGTAPETVAAAVTAVGQMVDKRDFTSRGLKLYPVGMKPDLVARVKPALIVLGFAAGFLVLVLMVNLASVLLSRAASREREFAVSRALGANGFAIARATLFEGAILGFLGGAVASLAAVWGTRAMVAMAPLDLPRREAIGITPGIAVVVIGLGVLLGLGAALAPAIWAARSRLSSSLAASAVRGGGGHGRLRRGMVVAQVALSLVLLAAGGLVIRSFDRLLSADPGFRPDGVLTLRVPMPTQLIAETADVLSTQDRIVQALDALPGVTGVSAVTALPLSAGASQTTIAIPGAPGNTGNRDQDRPLVDYMGTRAGYIEVMGMRIVNGRTFDPVRRPDVREALIDTHVAAKFFPTGNPLGAKIPFGNDQNLTIVGVVDQPRLYDVHEDGRPQLFVRAEDWNYRNLFYVMRTTQDPASLGPAARAAVRGVNPQLAVAEVQPMTDIVSGSLRQQRTSAVLVGGFAIGALLLTSMGLFAVVSGTVTRRRHEISLRLALGADHGRVLRLVLREGAFVVALGVLIGAPGIYFAGGLLRGVLIGVSTWDPVTLAAVSSGLAIVALTACYIPARRVLGIQPAETLRQDA
jgi:putative ABC transport system permease protein